MGQYPNRPHPGWLQLSEIALAGNPVYCLPPAIRICHLVDQAFLIDEGGIWLVTIMANISEIKGAVLSGPRQWEAAESLLFTPTNFWRIIYHNVKRMILLMNWYAILTIHRYVRCRVEEIITLSRRHEAENNHPELLFFSRTCCFSLYPIRLGLSENTLSNSGVLVS